MLITSSSKCLPLYISLTITISWHVQKEGTVYALTLSLLFERLNYVFFSMHYSLEHLFYFSFEPSIQCAVCSDDNEKKRSHLHQKLRLKSFLNYNMFLSSSERVSCFHNFSGFCDTI